MSNKGHRTKESFSAHQSKRASKYKEVIRNQKKRFVSSSVSKLHTQLFVDKVTERETEESEEDMRNCYYLS